MTADTPTPERPETFYAYYYWFDATGVEPVDDILRAVASAGKSYHHTESWQDPPYGDPDGPTERDKIAAAGDAAAAEIERLQADALLGWTPPLHWQGEPLMTLLLQVAGMAAGCVMRDAPDAVMPSEQIKAGILRVLAGDPRPCDDR